MIIKENHPVSAISWLSTLNGGGYVKHFFEPESIEELYSLCKDFYEKGIVFDIIGHTSNTLYTPDYLCEYMVSTRKLNDFVIQSDCILCQCGTSVRKLSLAAVDAGIKGFEGLVDLPGTVASAIYGHATCYGCDLSTLLVNATILTTFGEILTVNPDWFAFKKRSSALKRGEKKAIILSVALKRENGIAKDLARIANLNHDTRRITQPEAKNSLGSIFKEEGKRTKLNYFITSICKLYSFVLKVMGLPSSQIDKKRRHLFFSLLGGLDVEPYVRQWNWYQWTDKRSHDLFWKYVRLHRRMFTKSEFEIEIKHNSNFKIP